MVSTDVHGYFVGILWGFCGHVTSCDAYLNSRKGFQNNSRVVVAHDILVAVLGKIACNPAG